MGIQLTAWVENIMGKGEIACYEQFLFYHNVFKSCLVLMRQNKYLWSEGLNQNSIKHKKTWDCDLIGKV